MMHLSENPRFQSLDEARRINIYNIINVMESVRAYRFRLYPDAKRQREIDEQIELARFLYNKLLGLAKEEYLKDRNLQITKSTFNRLMKGIVRENVMENFAVLSDGKKIGKPNFAAIREKRIARWQRVVARRQKGSRRREKAREKLHDSWEKVNGQSDDFARKTANDLISSGYTSFAVEGLHIRNMLKNHRLAGAINRAACNGFIRVLTYKAEDAGMRVYPVEPKDTTRRCSACSAVRDISLGERTYSCAVCGLRIDRDINAARNILHRSTAGHAGIEARGDPASLHPETDAKAGP